VGFLGYGLMIATSLEIQSLPMPMLTSFRAGTDGVR
jgi:hypothetical protein